MSLRLSTRLLLCSFALVCLTAANASAEAELDLEGVKCLVANKPASAEASADYKEGKVYFCCNGCKAKFEEKTKKYTAKANRQLVETKQYKQVACPISGGDLNEDESVKLGKKLTVSFCCGKCKGKVVEAKKEKKGVNQLVFAAKPFEKAFAVVEEEETEKVEASTK